MPAAPTDPRLRIWFSQTWGTMRTEARSYSRKDGTVIAGVDDQATYPLFGFHLEQESYPIAEWRGDGVRFYPPPRAVVEFGAAPQKAKEPVKFERVPAESLAVGDGARKYLDVPTGSQLRVSEGDSHLLVTVDLLKDRAGWDVKKAMFYLLFLIAAGLGPPLAFFLIGPDPTLVGRAMSEARAKQGLPAVPEPIDMGDGTKRADGPARPDGTTVIPVSVR